jgi:hypothetical protein
MIPAEKEALTLAAQRVDKGWYGQSSKLLDHLKFADMEYIALATPEAILSLLSDLASMEVTLGNAVSLAEFQAARIAKLEDIMRWLNGEEGDFPKRPPYAGAYWWRNDLRKKLSELLAPPSPDVKENPVK